MNKKNKANLLDRITQYWVKLTGRKLNESDFDWLKSPFGDEDQIADQFVPKLADKEKLIIRKNEKDFGLLEDIDDFGLSTNDLSLLNPRIADFYTKTSRYDFEIWSVWNGIFRPFGWLLKVIFSKRLQQLNLPLSPMDSAYGIESNIIKLKDQQETTRWTIWFRILRSTEDVIYSGIYGTTTALNIKQRCLKVAFPLPNGAAVVVMKIRVKEDGSLLLISDGKRFGDAGFYFTLRHEKDKHFSARFVRSMHETIHVYEDAQGVLRTDHKLWFWGIRFLTLHYKIIDKANQKT